ncbi:MAG: ribonuclease H-like domain-containing protein [Spirochaetes bacterium]|nr:ribonuclease H-like domain-containing protein [Spirochaetota bacterium]
MRKEKKEQKDRLDRIGAKLRERLYRIRGDEILPKENKWASDFYHYRTDQDDFSRARKLKIDLLEKYRNCTIQEAVPGKNIQNEKGECYLIEKQTDINSEMVNPLNVNEKILSHLRLVWGIGFSIESCLKKRGYHTINDLQDHPRFKKHSSDFLKIFQSGRKEDLLKWISRWLGRSHPLMFLTSGFFNKENFLFVDIETLGLFSRPVILIGLAFIKNSKFNIIQYFIRDIQEEPSALKAFLSHVKNDTILVTYNGRAFDIPYIKERLTYYGIRAELGYVHYDMLPFSRRIWKGRFPDCSLTTIEKFYFKTIRTDDVPSGMVPDFYDTYLRTGNIGPLVPIIQHNSFDLFTLGRIFFTLHKIWQ